jgi:ABC-2 type transport system ATP-binding protein
MEAITVTNLTKIYKGSIAREGVWGSVVDLFAPRSNPITAVDAISFVIESGSIVGLIGPNGAGKSTTIKMMTGILRPTSGDIIVRGIRPFAQRRRHAMQIGVVFGQRTQLWWDLAVIEAFKLLKTIYRVPDSDFSARLAQFNEVLDLEPLLGRQVRRLSLGQRMRCDLAASLLHNPPVLFLDEPTIGMDVAVKARMRQFVHLIRRQYGTTIILTTHDTADIEELSDRLLVIDKGSILFDGSLDRFKTTYGRQRTLVVDFNQPPDMDALRKVLNDPNIKLSAPFAGRVQIIFDRTANTAHRLIGLISDHFSVRDVSTSEVEVEDIVREIYEGFYS